MDKNSEIPAWISKLIPVVESWARQYELLSQEQRIWFWIAATLALLTIVVTTIYLIYRTIRGLNTLLQSPEGWRPVCFKCWMWVGSGIWLILVAWKMRFEEVSGWTAAAAAGVLTIIGFVWFMFRRLKLMRGIGATVVNGSIGMIVAPVVIQSAALLLILVVAGIGLWIYAIFNPAVSCMSDIEMKYEPMSGDSFFKLTTAPDSNFPSHSVFSLLVGFHTGRKSSNSEKAMSVFRQRIRML